MYDALEAAWAKYNRAARDLRVLHDNAGRFFERDPYRIEVDLDETGWHIVRVRIREEPPPVFGVLVGSVAHQAYSALNHVTWALVARNLGEQRALERGIRSRVDFPICDNPREFRRRDVLTHIGPDAAAKLEELQPFHRERGPHGKIQHPLLLMKELADADKHRVLPATYGAVDLSSTSLEWDPSASDPTYERLLPEDEHSLKDGTKLSRVRFARGNATAAVRVREQPEVELVFESDTWAGLSVFSVGDCLATADRCLTVLSMLFPNEPWPPSSHDPASPYAW